MPDDDTKETIACSACGRVIGRATAFKGICGHCMLQGGRDAVLASAIRPSTITLTHQAGETIGNYVLGEKIGEGGFGVVYKAEQTAPVRRTVAFKLIKPGMDSYEVVARFEAERQALAMMKHPNVATVFDGGSTSDGRPFFAMEFVMGEPITLHCDRHKLTVPDRVQLVREVCAAVQHAHQKGIVHRDLKPSNVLVSNREEGFRVKVIDFGVAKAIRQELTQKTLFTAEGRMVGTPEYMSPEQTGGSGADIDTRSDIYSLGVLLYELLTGGTPIDSTVMRNAGYGEMERMIREEEPPKPSKRIDTLEAAAPDVAERRSTDRLRLARSLRGDLDWIVLKALAKERDRRYETVDAFSSDLKRHLNDQTVTAKPPSASYQIGKFVRRHRGAILAVAAVFAALVAGIIATAWQAIRATQAKEESDRQRYVAEMNVAGGAILRSESTARAQELVSHWKRSARRGWEWHFFNALSEQSLLQIRGHEGRVNGLDWSPDGSLIASGGRDGFLHVWNARTGREHRMLGSHDGEIHSVAWNPGGDALASVGADGCARVWDAESGKMTAAMSDDGDTALGSLAWRPDGQQLAIGGSGYLAVWDPGRKEPSRRFEIPHHSDVRMLFWNEDGTHLSAAWLEYEGGAAEAMGRFEVQYHLIVWEPRSGREIANAVIPLGKNRNMASHDRMHSEVSSWNSEGSRIAIPVRAFDPDQRGLAGTGRSSLRLVGEDGVSIGSVFEGVAGEVQSLDWSSEGTTIATGGSDHAVSLWSVDNDAGAITKRFRGHHGVVQTVRWSPDGSRLASGGVDGTIRIWNPNRAQEIRTLWVPPRKQIARTSSTVAWSPEGTHLAVAGAGVDDDLFLWNPVTGKPVFEIKDPGHRMQRVAWHPAGRLLATGGLEGRIKIWTMRTRRGGHENDDLPEHMTIPTARGKNLSLAFNPEGDTLAWASSEGRIKLFDTATGSLRKECRGHAGQIDELCWSPDGRRIASASQDETVRIWDAASGEELAVLTRHLMAVFTIDWHPDSTRLASAGQDGTIRIWDMTDYRERQILRGHAAPIRSVRWSPDGLRLASGGHDRSLRIWDAINGVELATLSLPEIGSPQQVAWSPDGKSIALAVAKGSVVVLDASESYGDSRAAP